MTKNLRIVYLLCPFGVKFPTHQAPLHTSQKKMTRFVTKKTFGCSSLTDPTIFSATGKQRLHTKPNHLSPHFLKHTYTYLIILRVFLKPPIDLNHLSFSSCHNQTYHLPLSLSVCNPVLFSVFLISPIIRLAKT